jgi:hypothetical protein
MRLEYLPEPNWPVLAWLAECHPDRVRVRHGARVETRPGWFCDAVWDGPFGDGGFDLTDIVAGSGGRLRDGVITFVPAGNTVDRLQSIDLPAADGGRGVTLVSNSLACLLAVAGAAVPPLYRYYRRDLRTVVKGLRKYRRTLETSRGPATLWYFNNVRWDARALRELAKPDPERDFSAFEPYHAFLRHTMDRVTRNAADAARRHPLGLMGTMSSGYDSTTVATLASEFGLREFLTLDRAREKQSDSGLEAGRVLGLRPILIEREAWRRFPLPEVPFLTADAQAQDRFFLGAADHLRGKLMFTGFHGDKVWGQSPYGPDSLAPHPEIKRGDPSGLSVTEFRLSAGFVHCPVPFWGARHVHRLVAISRDPSMTPWDVGGDYTRPICRRIVEGAGVPRDAFGRRKLAGSVLDAVLSESSAPDYRRWCAAHGIEGEWLDRAVRKALRTLPKPVRWKVQNMFYGPRTPTYRDHFFPWALEVRGRLYRSAPRSESRISDLRSRISGAAPPAREPVASAL